mgnify:FL=1
MENSKPRIICLLKLLEKYTDEDHQLTTSELSKLLEKEYEITVHRITFKKDIESLQNMGYDIIETRSSQNKYFLRSRDFELPELKLLIDAVESSKFITSSKREILIDKINNLTSVYQKDKLKRNNYVVKNIKPNNELIYYIVDAINDAINQGKQISFQYYEYTGLKKKILKNKGEIYKLSPYHLVWNGDYYYVLGYSEKREKVISFRVDRIANTPEILDKKCHLKPKDFDLNEYTKSVFFMFGCKKTRVELRCDNSLMKTIIDRFGEDVTTLAYDMESFKVIVDVEVSPTFYGWVFGFDGTVEILNPKNIKNEYNKMIDRSFKNVNKEN